MKRIDLDSAPPTVREFFLNLPIDEGVELVLDGKVVCYVLPSTMPPKLQRDVLIGRARELTARFRERNKGTPAKVIERETQDAVDEVRRRKR
jgi:hypothetical protein